MIDRPHRQRVAAYGVLLDGSRVLLVRASQLSALPDTWWLPGGGVDFGEHPRECVVREFAEETGLEVGAGRLIDVVSDVQDWPHAGESVHTTRLLYDVTLKGGALRAEADGTTDAVEWQSIDDALRLGLMPFVRDALTAKARELPQR